ncbi:MAG: polyamine ABC transporter substrate-binding protein [Nitrospiraceae bacterium]|nr:polyamine ABC transporter substrate-binding protein [Nitrospiraceae bacterium]
MYRKLLITGLVVCLMVGAFAVGALTAPANKTLRIAFDAADLKTLDPYYAAATMDRAVVDMVFNGLVRYKPGDISQFEPDLATSYEISSDGRTWTFHLRKGVMFHPWNGNPGYEMTAADVVFSLNRAANPKTSAYAGGYSGFTVTAVDKYTVQITTEKALSPALFLPKVANYAGGFIVSKKAVEALGDSFKTHPVGTGPFMFKSYSPMQKVVLVANTKYFRGAPLLDQVEVWYMPDVNARKAGLETGELDVIEGVREQMWVNAMKAVPNTVVDVFGPGETVTVHLNVTSGPLQDIRVRRAIAYAISRAELLAFIGSDVATPLYSAVPPMLAGGLTKEEVAKAGLLYQADLAKAKQLLADAGYANGFSFNEVISERASYRQPFVNIQSQLKKVGINLNLQVVDHSTYHAMIRKDVNPITLYICWRPNADVFLTRFYYSASIVVTGAKPDTNFSHYTGIDWLIDAARTELNPTIQSMMWQTAQLKLLEDVASYPLYILQFVFARNAAVNYGYDLKSTLALYPQITEKTHK